MPETGSNFGQGFFVVLAPGSDVQIKLKANTLGSEIFLRCPHLFQPYIYLIIWGLLLQFASTIIL